MNRSAKKLKLRIQLLRQPAKPTLLQAIARLEHLADRLSDLDHRPQGGTDYARHPA